MDISTALASVSTAMGIAKTISDINKDFDASVYKLQMAELRSALADAKVALADVQEELRAKDAEIRRLVAFEVDLAALHLDRGFYYSVIDGRPAGRPYCPFCIESSKGLFRLHQSPQGIRDDCFCGNCHNTYSRAVAL